VEEDEGLLQFFNLLLDEALVGSIVDETNRYADQSRQKQPGTAKQWRPATHDEMHAFLALVILQSIVKFPDHQLYWSQNPVLSVPFFSQCPTAGFSN
jgi:hypothetical protein